MTRVPMPNTQELNTHEDSQKNTLALSDNTLIDSAPNLPATQSNHTDDTVNDINSNVKDITGGDANNQTNNQNDETLTATTKITKLAERFRKFMPVVVDVETAGFNAHTDALLEIACIPILMDEQGNFYQGEPLNAHIEPFEGANLDPRALEFTGIDPNNPMRKLIAEEEKPALRRIFKELKTQRKAQDCNQCVLVGHNAHFDLNFVNAAIERTNSKNHSPFHKFSVFDTVSLAALAYGQTVLAKACKAAGIDFDGSEAHSALYDTHKTAELFCHILNSYPILTLSLPEDNTTTEQSGVELNEENNT